MNAGIAIQPGLPELSRTDVTGDLKSDLSRAIEAIDGWNWLHRGETILVKADYNSANPPPGSTAPDFLRAALMLLRDHGADQLILGESTLMPNHWQVLEQAGALAVAKELDAQVMIFDEDGWENTIVGGCHLANVQLARVLSRVDHVVYLCCPKTHHLTQFTGSLKLGMGFVNNWERTVLHLHDLQYKIADLNLVLKPDLILADMRCTFIDKGPAKGTRREPGVLLASRSRVALDLEAVRIIQSYPGHKLPGEARSLPQIAHAIQLGIDPIKLQAGSISYLELARESVLF